MELTRQAGNEPPLVGLMRVYKDYYPDVIVGDVVSGRATVFTVSRLVIHISKIIYLPNIAQHPNREWREKLGEIQAIHFQRTQDGRAPERRAFRVTRQAASGGKRAKRSVIPEVLTSHAQEVSKFLPHELSRLLIR
jgi:centromere protein I